MLETLEPFLKQAEATGKLKPAAIAEGLKTLREQIYQDFDRGVPAEQLIRGTSRSVDRVLEFCFLHFIGEQDSCNCCLVAVGGYGRSELLPGSDIDLMLLLEKKPGKAQQQQISSFLTFLWDIGLEVGHSVRTVKDCVRQGKADVTVMTNMIESRPVYGDLQLYDKYQKAIGPRKIWSSRKFFEAKLEEQHERHLRFNDTEDQADFGEEKRDQRGNSAAHGNLGKFGNFRVTPDHHSHVADIDRDSREHHHHAEYGPLTCSLAIAGDSDPCNCAAHHGQDNADRQIHRHALGTGHKAEDGRHQRHGRHGDCRRHRIDMRLAPDEEKVGNCQSATAGKQDKAGWKGYREGDVGVHRDHALVLVNYGHATGAELVDLSERIRASVHDKFGVSLTPEVRII